MENFLEDGVLEIIDLLDQTISSALLLENSLILNERFDEDQYKIILRNLHSIKGASGMLGISELMEFVHELESSIISYYSKKQIDIKFTDQLIRYLHIIVDYLEGDTSALELISDHKSLFVKPNIQSSNDELITAKRQIKNIKGTTVAINRLKSFGCEYLSTPDDYKPSVIHINSSLNPELNSKIQDQISKSIVYNFGCINDVYTNSFVFKYNKFFLINLEGIRTNPFFLQKICRIFKKNMDFIYYAKSKEVLDFHAESIKDEQFDYHYHQDIEDAIELINKKVNTLISF